MEEVRKAIRRVRYTKPTHDLEDRVKPAVLIEIGHKPKKKKTKAKKSVDELAVGELRFKSLRNVLLEQYTQGVRWWEESSVASYTPPVIEAYADKDYRGMLPVFEQREKSFDYEKVKELQKAAKFADLKLTPWKASPTNNLFKMVYFDDYAAWKWITPGGELLAFIAYDLA